MNRRLLSFVSLFLVLALLSVLAPTRVYPLTAQTQSSSPATQVASQGAAAPVSAATSTHASPVLFIENVGQWDQGARFQVQGGPGSAMWLAEDAIWLTLLEPQVVEPETHGVPDLGQVRREPQPRKGAHVKLSFVGANPHPRLEPFDRLDTKVSYFLGNDPANWNPDVPVWAGVRYVDLYPGVDLEMSGEGGRIVPQLVARASADPGVVRLRVEGAQDVAVEGAMLRLSTAVGDAAWPLLLADAFAGQGKVRADAASIFDVLMPFTPSREDNQPGTGSASPADEPSNLLYATFLGGSWDDQAFGVALGTDGAVYVIGETSSYDFPTTVGSFDRTYNGGESDAFAVKLRASDLSLAYAVFLGGGDIDKAAAIAVDATGAAYLTGRTESPDFPATLGAFDTHLNGVSDTFIAKLDPLGSDLVYATLLGGNYLDEGFGIAVDGDGAAYVAGQTLSTDFPSTEGAFSTTFNGGNTDAFVAKLSSTGSGLVYATFLGGSEYDGARAITLDGSGMPYVTGQTFSYDFPTTQGAFDTTFSNDDAFVVKLNPSGSDLIYATFLGGTSHYDSGLGIVLDGSGAAYVTGRAGSGFPTTPDAFDTTFNGDQTDVFVVKLSPTASDLVYATYLGGSGNEWGEDIALDGNGAVHVTGWTTSSDFPTSPDAFDTTFRMVEGFAARLNPSGSDLGYASFLGGSWTYDDGYGIAMDASGKAYIVGQTGSSDFPTTPDAFDTTLSGDTDAFVVKLAMGGEPAPTYSISGHVRDTSGDPILGVTVSAGPGGSDVTDADGAYTITGLPAGAYILIPSLAGWIFTPPSRTVSVPPDATEQDFTGSPVPALQYIGPLFLPEDSANPVEEDHRITMGDHVHVSLPFKNVSTEPIYNPTVEVLGSPFPDSSIGVKIHNGKDWADLQTLALAEASIYPGEVATADFWIYVENPDPEERDSLSGAAWLRISADEAQWLIGITVLPIEFSVGEHQELLADSCLHHPSSFEIQRYAQYAAGALFDVNTSPTDLGDPDLPEQALANLVERVRTEFDPSSSPELRVEDTTLLQRRNGALGTCRHYTDLTIGLVRALNLPSRFTGATILHNCLIAGQLCETLGHAWAEVYVAPMSGWVQADATWNLVAQEWYYEENPGVFGEVAEAYADLHPLSTATSNPDLRKRCIPECFEGPVDCPLCLEESNTRPIGWPWPTLDPTCVEDVRWRYHDVAPAQLAMAAGYEGLSIQLQAPMSVTQTVPFTVSAGLVNSTSLALEVLTATVSSHSDVGSTLALFEVDPGVHAVSGFDPGETITVTWTVTPLVAGSGVPLGVGAFSGEIFSQMEHPLLVTQPGILPSLTVGMSCAPEDTSPGMSTYLTAYTLNEFLQPMADENTDVKATIYSTPTLLYSTTFDLILNEADGLFQAVLDLPGNAPIGRYQVDVAASHPDYEPDNVTSFLFVTPPLDLVLTPSRVVLGMQDTLTLTAAVSERGEPNEDAGVWAEIGTPGGSLTVPMLPADGGNYTVAFRPIDLAASLSGQVLPGTWRILASADYLGGESTAEKTVVVQTYIYLPLILRNH